jgi:hypothetical protein
MQEKICPGCGSEVACGPAPGQEHCWCAELPRIMPVPQAGIICFCPECLRRNIASRERERGTDGGHP